MEADQGVLLLGDALVDASRKKRGKSIEEAFTAGGTAETGDAILTAHFTLEFVVVSELFVCQNEY